MKDALFFLSRISQVSQDVMYSFHPQDFHLIEKVRNAMQKVRNAMQKEIISAIIRTINTGKNNHEY